MNESFVEDTFRVPRTSRGLLLKPLAPWRGQHKIQFDALPSVYSGRGVPLSLIASGIAPGGIFRDCMEPVFCGSILMLRVSVRVSEQDPSLLRTPLTYARVVAGVQRAGRGGQGAVAGSCDARGCG